VKPFSAPRSIRLADRHPAVRRNAVWDRTFASGRRGFRPADAHSMTWSVWGTTPASGDARASPKPVRPCGLTVVPHTDHRPVTFASESHERRPERRMDVACACAPRTATGDRCGRQRSHASRDVAPCLETRRNGYSGTEEHRQRRAGGGAPRVGGVVPPPRGPPGAPPPGARHVWLAKRHDRSHDVPSCNPPCRTTYARTPPRGPVVQRIACPIVRLFVM
jgi:hypothetical protein